MSSDTTGDRLNTIRDRLLAFVDDSGRQLSTYVGVGASARIFSSLAHDQTAYPYLVVRSSSGETDPEFANLRETFDVEITVYHRPRGTNQKEAELLADLAEAALLTWQESSASLGLTYGQYRKHRETLTPEPDADVRDLVEIELVVTCGSWPRKLTNALT